MTNQDDLQIREQEKTLLVVEDSLTQALKLQKLLEDRGFKTIMAQNGKEAMERLNTGPVDMVISDVLMPEMDGYQLCKEIKSSAQFAHLPILLLTTLKEPEDIVKGLESGADNFVTKPYEEEILISRIRYILINQIIRSTHRSQFHLEVFFAGKKHCITADRMQILDLLFSTYEEMLQQKKELEKTNAELNQTIAKLTSLEGILPICAHCKKIRDEQGNWQQLEQYIHDHSDAEFSHGVCPECKQKYYPSKKR